MKLTDTASPWYRRMLSNSRFWILAIAVTLSVNIAGIMQLVIASSSLQTIRIEQWYGFIALLLLYIAIVTSPLTKLFPRFPGREAWLHARRAIGVSAFYFAFLHVCISFFQQLDGFAGLGHFNRTYRTSLLLGSLALGILFIMAATSLDIVVARMGYKHWKLLHRLVYVASVAILIHVILIGPHYDSGLSLLGAVTYIAGAILVVLEVLRIRHNWHNKRAVHV